MFKGNFKWSSQLPGVTKEPSWLLSLLAAKGAARQQQLLSFLSKCYTQ